MFSSSSPSPAISYFYCLCIKKKESVKKLLTSHLSATDFIPLRTFGYASTLADFYFSIGAGIAALYGPLHGGANEKVMLTLNEIGSAEAVSNWVQNALKEKRKIPGFGHRVYKAYDPRARILSPLAEFLVKTNRETESIYKTALTLEDEVLKVFGKEKKIFPNVDFYSGIIYSCLGIPLEMFTPMFAVSRVAGWTARILEYHNNNRIFRPRAIYTGEFNKQYTFINKRR